jgi:branched-chain amino acid transport system substrate-binding protein
MRFSKTLWCFTLLALAVFGLQGCQKKEESGKPGASDQKKEAGTTKAGEGPIKIGGIFSITGPVSNVGDPEAKTARMLVDKINAQGGINGRQIELSVEDDQGNETQAVNAANQLIKQGVVAIIGPSRSGTTLAIADLCNQKEVPLISCAAAAVITDPVRPYIFKTAPKDSDAAEQIFDHMTAHGVKRVGLLTDNTSFGQEGLTQMKKVLPKYPGLEIVATESFGKDDSDLRPQLSKIQAAGAEAIVGWSILQGQSIMLKNAKTLGLTIPLYQSHGFANIEYVKAAGEAAEGVFFPASRILVAEQLADDDPLKKTLVEYKKEYETTYKTDVCTFGGHVYDALYMITDAVEKKGADRKAIRDHLETIKDFKGTAGVFNLSPEDHTGLTKAAFEMLTVKNGAFTIAPK